MTIRGCAVLSAFVFLCTPAVARASSGEALARWFGAGRCPAFNTAYSASTPFARNDSERLEWMNRFAVTFQPGGNPSYVYDRKHGTVFRSIGGDSTGSRTWRTIGPPPARVAQSDLSRLATTSGITLGTPASVVVQKLGTPRIIRACGLERYQYMIDRQVGGNSLEFTIRNGRVVEIFQTYGD